MAKSKSWTLMDVERDLWEEQFELRADEFGVASIPWVVRKRTLRGGLREGVDLIEVDNGALSFFIVPTRGMGIWRGKYHGNVLGWYAPVRGPVHPKFVNVTERGGLGWLQGFDELVCRCGLDSNGAPGKDVIVDNQGNRAEVDLTLHGKIANLPAHFVDLTVTGGDETELKIVGHVEESMLFSPQLRLISTITTRVNSNRFTISDEIVNLRDVPAELELLYHCNFGGPFLEEGARLEAPIREVAPRDARAVQGLDGYNVYRGPTAGYVEQVYWYDLAADASGKTLTMLRNAHGDQGVVLRFNKKELPCFTQWKNTASLKDGYVTGLEPGTNYPNPKRFEREQGRVVRIPVGGSYKCSVEFEVQDDADGVARVEKEIAAIQKDIRPAVRKTPQPKYSPVG